MSQPTKKQWETWEELNFWYAMLHAPKTYRHYPAETIGGLCFLALFELGRNLPIRAEQHKPRNAGLNWWPPRDWTPRLRFIRKMIRLCERDLQGA